MNSKRVLDELIALHKNYSQVYRRTIALDKYNLARSGEIDIDPEDRLVRESLLEHVGSLPVVTTHLYPFLEHKNEINLGKVLIMLAVHDIGETVVGDGHPHQKTKEFIEFEYQEALKLLSKEYHPVLDEYEMRESLESKFAKSVDVFATFLSDQILPPKLVARRLSTHGFSSKLFIEKRYEIFEWDNFLKELFKEVVQRYKKVGV